MYLIFAVLLAASVAAEDQCEYRMIAFVLSTLSAYNSVSYNRRV